MAQSEIFHRITQDQVDAVKAMIVQQLLRPKVVGERVFNLDIEKFLCVQSWYCYLCFCCYYMCILCCSLMIFLKKKKKKVAARHTDVRMCHGDITSNTFTTSSSNTIFHYITLCFEESFMLYYSKLKLPYTIII